MRTVSFQGIQLSASERRRLQFQQQTRQAFPNPALAASVDAALERQREASEQGPQDDPYKFRLEYQSRGTPWVGDVFGYDR